MNPRGFKLSSLSYWEGTVTLTFDHLLSIALGRVTGSSSLFREDDTLVSYENLNHSFPTFWTSSPDLYPRS